MTAPLRWLLGIESVRAEGFSGLGVGLDRAAVFVWILPVLAAGLWMLASCYRREPVPRHSRLALNALRAAAFVWVALLITRPAAVFRSVHTEPSTTALLVDTSASMAVRDVGGQSRLDAFDVGWRQLWETGGLRPTGDRQWRVYSFDGRLHGGSPPGASAADRISSLKPVGPRTDLGAALNRILADARREHLTGVVIASDGRSNVPADWQQLAALARRNSTIVHAVRLGPDPPPPSLSIGPLWAPARVFTFDPVQVRTSITAGHLGPTQTILVEACEQKSGTVLVSKSVSTASSHQQEKPGKTVSRNLQLTLPPLAAGIHHLEIRARTAAAPEVVAQPQPLEIEASEHRLRVLYVEAYPRFEYRYLKNLLARESSIESSCLLLSADSAFVQEGTTPISTFPQRGEELYSFDVIVLGDLDPSGTWWTTGQQDLLQTFVDRRGGGLIILAGRRWMPGAVSPGSVLERLLPVSLAAPAGGGGAAESFIPALTAAGRGHPMLQFEDDGESDAPWLTATPALFWSAPLGPPKPGAETLLERPMAEGAAPLLVLGRYGAGRVLLHGSDDTWRWRKELGGRYHDAYWLGAIRYLARSKLLGQDRRVLLEADRQQYAAGEVVRLRLTALDPLLAAEWSDRIAVAVTDGRGEVVAHIDLIRTSPGAPELTASWMPDDLGQFSFVVDPAVLPGVSGSVREAVQVAADAEELRDASPDPHLLNRLATATGGVSLSLDELSRLPGLLQDRPTRTMSEASAPMWDTPVALLFVVALLAAEWLARKGWGLA